MIYRFVLRGERKGDGFFTNIGKRKPETIKKATEKLYRVPVEMIAEPSLTETDTKIILSAYLRGDFRFI